jgi:membrane protein YdbS with pleckstrin-like domain
VIGVTMRQSLFQRRLGLTSLTVTTAAGRQQYPVTDLADDTASALAQQLVTNWSEKRLRDPARCCVCAQSSAAPSPGQRGTR